MYTNGSFAKNADSTNANKIWSFLCDADDDANVLQFSSQKSRSVLGGNVMAFVDGMDYWLTIRKDIEHLTRWKLKLKMLTDSKSLFDVITPNTTAAKKRLMIDFRAIREAYARMEIDGAVGIRRERSLADSLTKPKETRN